MKIIPGKTTLTILFFLMNHFSVYVPRDIKRWIFYLKTLHKQKNIIFTFLFFFLFYFCIILDGREKDLDKAFFLNKFCLNLWCEMFNQYLYAIWMIYHSLFLSCNENRLFDRRWKFHFYLILLQQDKELCLL